ncbi:MAG TPA: SDR family oxidoreductase [Mycobacteriales bacterium]|nr:SDR family oxidoreductase [Mycobacteriales bacterium]
MTEAMPTRVALVTGSSAGIGAAIARRLGSSDWTVVVNSHRSVEAGRSLAAELPSATYIQADVADAAEAERLIAETVVRYGRLDLLVNNAGATRVIPHGDLGAATPEVWRELYAVNVIGPWQLIVAAVPHLREHGDGCVINISSIAGVRPLGSSIPYAVSKAALNHLTRLLAATLGPEIRVNAVAPGLVDTDWTADWDEVREMVRATTPARRSGLPDDVAGVVEALVRARYTTGEIWLVDGGLHLR